MTFRLVFLIFLCILGEFVFYTFCILVIYINYEAETLFDDHKHSSSSFKYCEDVYNIKMPKITYILLQSFTLKWVMCFFQCMHVIFQKVFKYFFSIWHFLRLVEFRDHFERWRLWHVWHNYHNIGNLLTCVLLNGRIFRIDINILVFKNKVLNGRKLSLVL